MSNERYLQVSYFAVLLCSLGLGFVTHGLLRRSFLALCDDSRSRVALFVRRFFLPGIVAPAVLGFCSVSYISCETGTYERVIESRDYLVRVNLEQLQATMRYTIVAVLLWCLVAFAILLTSRKEHNGSPAGARNARQERNRRS